MAANKLFHSWKGIWNYSYQSNFFFFFLLEQGQLQPFVGQVFTEKPAPVRTDLQMILTLTCIVFISYR